jgi:alpha-amylase/alpha-mannosidase (GH57 family)
MAAAETAPQRRRRSIFMERCICIHGHFYQPPRENPWLEAIELQDSAYPYHDWNERITAQCYAANSVSRILDAEGRIDRLVNNYAKISFNFGPTLLSWLEAKAPDVYLAILRADRESRENYSGHGSALAQAYNHVIMPLANTRDRRTQVRWGIADFEYRFTRKPEGMWLPETAVDIETLEILAEFGIKFTVLAPHQAARVRRIGETRWHDFSGGRIDPTRAYEQRLPSGRKIALFFYDGPVSRAVAFEGLLTRGENLANRLLGVFSEDRERSQLAHIATDGESYGHHHRFGDMALAYALNHIESHGLAKLTNYGEFLERNPPTHQVEIVQKTSWSCFHGIDRWWSNCGCNSGGHPGWNQEWRKPLRNGLDWLRDRIAAPFERVTAQLLKSPWAARDDYVSVVLDRSSDNVNAFFSRNAARELADNEKTTALKLLEMQRHAMLMYTSCGWFFDELSGIETTQVMQYAGRAVQLAQEVFGDYLESQFLQRLAEARSNFPEQGDGRRIYENFVKPAQVNWERAGAHYAVSSLFQDYPEQTKIYCFDATRGDYQVFTAGLSKMAVGRVSLTSEITRESEALSFAVLHMGDHNVNGGVRKFVGNEGYAALKQEVVEPFQRADFAEVIRIFDRRFGESNYSVSSLFRDEQRKVVDVILASSLREAETLYHQIYERRAPMMRFLTNLHIPLPKAWGAAAEFVLNGHLRAALEQEDINPDLVRSLLQATTQEGVSVDAATLEFAFRLNLERLAERLSADPTEACLKQLQNATSVFQFLPFAVDLWRVQNIYYGLFKNLYPKMRQAESRGDDAAKAWLETFSALGRQLGIKISPMPLAHRLPLAPT